MRIFPEALTKIKTGSGAEKYLHRWAISAIADSAADFDSDSNRGIRHWRKS
jgi:hypothetical protein